MKAPGVLANRGVRRLRRDLLRRVHQAPGWVAGLRYRLAGRHPAADVSDLVLADRVRSELGRTLHRLDIGHPNVMVTDAVVTLHGVVEHDEEAMEVEEAAGRVTGVRNVVSHLYIGPAAGDWRPSEGRAVGTPSWAYRRLLRAALDAGADIAPGAAVQAVLHTLLAQLPDDEADQLLGHLPADVRTHVDGHFWDGEGAGCRRDIESFVDAVVAAAAPTLDPERAQLVTESVLAVVRELVPEERNDVAAVLPPALRQLWLGAVAV